MKKYYFLAIVLFLCKFTFAQVESAVPFLAISNSSLLEGTGRIGAALPMIDAGGFYYNPAQLGYFARSNNLAVSFTPGKLVWMENIFPSTNVQMYNAAVGYNFSKLCGLPLSIGIGYARNKFSYGNYVKTYEDYDSFDCFSIGASYNYYLLFNLGFSFKNFNSVLVPLGAMPANNQIYKASSSAVDFGAMIIMPVSRLFFNNVKCNLDKRTFIKPLVKFTLGYALTNVGKEISYVDPAQKDPIPRTARIGYTFDFGFDMFIHGVKVNALDYSFTAEAEDLLIKQNFPNVEYQGLLGDISIGKNLISLKGDNNVVLHRGHIFRLFETFIFTSGRMTGKTFQNPGSYTHGFSSEGITKLLSLIVKNRVINFIADHFAVEYYNANTFDNSIFNTKLTEFSIFAKNITL